MFGFLARLFKPRTVDPIIAQINNEARDRAITFWLPPPINGQGRPTNQVIPSSSPLTTPVLSSPFLPQPPNNLPFVLQGSSQLLVVESQEPEERANISAYQQLSRAPTEAYSSHDYTVQSTYPPSVSSGLQADTQHLPPRAVPSSNQVHTLATTFSGRNHYLERTVPLPDISPSLPGTYDAVADNLESSGSPTGVEARAPQLAASRAVAIERAVPFSPPLPTPGTERSVRREEWLNGPLMDFPIVGHEPSNGPSALFADGSRNSYELVEFVDKAQSRVFAKIEHCVDYVGPSTSRLVAATQARVVFRNLLCDLWCLVRQQPLQFLDELDATSFYLGLLTLERDIDQLEEWLNALETETEINFFCADGLAHVQRLYEQFASWLLHRVK